MKKKYWANFYDPLIVKGLDFLHGHWTGPKSSSLVGESDQGKMVLEGLEGVGWIAWGVGTLYLKKPCGGSLQYSWLSLYTLYALIFNCFSIGIMIDFAIQLIPFIRHSSLVPRILNMFLLIGSIAFSNLFKLLFFIHAKDIVKFLTDLQMERKGDGETSQKSSSQTFLDKSLRSSWCRYKIYIYVSTTYQLTTGTLLPVFMYHIKPEAYTLNFIPPPYSFIAFFFFGSLPSLVIIQLALVFVIVSTFHLLLAFENLFDLLHFHVLHVKRSGVHMMDYGRRGSTNKVHGPPRIIFTMDEEDDGSTTTGGEVGRGQYEETTREKIVHKIERIQRLCRLFDRILGRLYLGLIVRMVFVLIHSADTLFIDRSSNGSLFAKSRRVFSWIHLGYEASQFVLIFLGNLFHKRVQFRKDELAKLIFLSPSSKDKQEMKDVWMVLGQVAEWRITACEIFTIDKPLIAGVVAVMMSYIVILFQVKLSNSESMYGRNMNSSSFLI